MEIPAKRFGRSGSALQAWVRALEATAPIAARPRRVLPDVIEELALRFGDAPALLSQAECLSFRALASRMNQYARWTLASGVDKGGSVALLMPNRPEYMAIWLGITRAGCVAALLNTNLEAKALAHAIDAVKPAHVIVAAELASSMKSAEPFLRHEP